MPAQSIAWLRSCVNFVAVTTPSTYDDPKLPFQRALKLGIFALLIILVVSLLGWGFGVGMPGVWAVLLGGAIGGSFVLLTALSALATAHASPSTTGAVILGGWLLKVVVLIGVLMVLRDLEFYHRVAFFVTVVLAFLATLGAELFALLRTKTTYVNPS